MLTDKMHLVSMASIVMGKIRKVFSWDLQNNRVSCAMIADMIWIKPWYVSIASETNI